MAWSCALLPSTDLKLYAANGYLALLEDVDLRKEVGEAALAEFMPPCAR